MMEKRVISYQELNYMLAKIIGNKTMAAAMAKELITQSGGGILGIRQSGEDKIVCQKYDLEKSKELLKDLIINFFRIKILKAYTYDTPEKVFREIGSLTEEIDKIVVEAEAEVDEEIDLLFSTKAKDL